MSNSSLQVGDVVRLKSGGPAMTVDERCDDDVDSVICQWFNNTQLSEGTFPSASLEKTTVSTGSFGSEPRRF
jgi:uncharacterized protein YodC (DUF2158 family)